MKVPTMSLFKEMMRFSDAAWEYQSRSEVKRTCKAFKVVRERCSKEIKLFTVRGSWCRTFSGESINDIGMDEVLTYTEFKKLKEQK